MNKPVIYSYINELAEVDLDTIKSFAQDARNHPQAKMIYINVNVEGDDQEVLLLVDPNDCPIDALPLHWIMDIKGD